MMGFLTGCFYLIGALFLLFEMAVFVDRLTLKELSKDRKFKESVTWIIFSYEIWVVVGLFSNQYPYFIALLILSLIPKNNYLWTKADNLLSIAAIVLMIVTKYH